ncbi:MAG: YceH family protein [Acidimicrobiia bacterium]|nr:YceH family protein [Acidimicrobiia bacterium]
MDLTAQHARVLACLIEKAETTPDSYPLTSKALRAACNQSTNRDPVVDYSEREVDAIMLELRQGGLARTVTGSGHRVGKHKHVVDETLGLDGHELAVLAVLVLRGDQTRNEITSRTARYARGPKGDADAVDAAIDRLAGRSDPFVVRLERRSGEREPRIEQRWAATNDGATPAMARVDAAHRSTTPADPIAPATPRAAPAVVSATPPHESDQVAALVGRVGALEAALAEQSRRLDELLEELGD